MLQNVFEFSTSSLLLAVLGLYILYCVIKAATDPLRAIPGPFLARFTRLWYFHAVYKGNFELTNVELHKKYGSVVRVAPNEYSIDDVDAAKTIYGHGSNFIKVPCLYIHILSSSE